MNIVDVIKSETKKLQKKTAVIDGNKQISYCELFAAVEKLAAELKACGIQPAQRVALLCEDSIDYIIVSLAVLSLPAVIVPISTSLSICEVDDILERNSYMTDECFSDYISFIDGNRENFMDHLSKHAERWNFYNSLEASAFEVSKE